MKHKIWLDDFEESVLDNLMYLVDETKEEFLHRLVRNALGIHTVGRTYTSASTNVNDPLVLRKFRFLRGAKKLVPKKCKD